VTDTYRSANEVDRIVARTPSRLRPAVVWLMGSWLGRCLFRIAARFISLEMFDRSMTVAAQVFTSVFPILIMGAAWLGSQYTDDIADAVELPPETRTVMEEALGSSSGSAFGIAGTAIVLISATSLSRALTRTFAAIWDLPRPKAGLVHVWRWLGAVLLLAVFVVLVRWVAQLTRSWSGAGTLSWIVPLTLDTFLAVLLPRILLSRQIPVRLLVPGGLIFGLVMLLLRPAISAFLPHALEVSADRYGTIGVAFTYIAWLYVLAFCFLVAALVGQVIATDPGRLGQWLRGSERIGNPVSPSAESEPTSRE
jgi:membrane protein